MSNGYATEDLEALLESIESDESDEADYEAAPRRINFRRPNVASGGNLYQARPQGNYVTQVQLQAALTRVGNQIKTNSDAIKTVNGRLATIGTEQTKQATALKKEVEERKKDMAKLQNNVEMSALLQAVLNPGTGGTLAALLPVLLLGGFGSSSGGDNSSNDQTTMLLLVLALSGGLGIGKGH